MLREREEHQVKAAAKDLGTARSEGFRIVPDQRGQGSHQLRTCGPARKREQNSKPIMVSSLVRHGPPLNATRLP